MGLLAFAEIASTGLRTLSQMDPALNIVIVDENPVRAAILMDGLRDAGYTRVTRIEETTNLLARIYSARS